MPEQKDSNNPETASEKVIWGGVTNPNQHNNRSFRYTVYGINPAAKFHMMAEGINFVKANLASQEEVGKQAIDLLHRPENVADRVGVSMSLIDQDHKGTWGNVGLIIEIPRENMIATSSSDLGSGGASAEWLRRTGQRCPILDPEQILQASGRDNYNEIAAWGTTETGSKLRLVGFYSKAIDGEDLDIDNAAILREHARRLGLPFVQIEGFKRYQGESLDYYPEDTLLKRKESFYVNHGGRRYVLLHDGEWQFKVLNYRMENHFMSPLEFQEINSYLQGLKGRTDIPQGFLESLEEKYEECIRERSKPKPDYGKDNEITGFRIRYGYGPEEKELRVSKFGAWEVNIPGEQREVRRSLANLGNMVLEREDFTRRVVDADFVDAKLQSVINSVDEETASKIASFLDATIVSAINDNFNTYLRNRRGMVQAGEGLDRDIKLLPKLPKLNIKGLFSPQEKKEDPGSKS